MIYVFVRNPQSDYFGQPGSVSREDWESDRFWLDFHFAGREMLMARSSLQR